MAIQVSDEPFGPEREQGFRSWMAKREYDLLIAIVEGKLKREETEMLEFIHRETEGCDSFAKLKLETARRLQFCVELLRQIRDQKEPHATVRFL